MAIVSKVKNRGSLEMVIISVARAQCILKTRRLSTEESIQRAFNDGNPRFVGKDYDFKAQNQSVRRTPDD